MKLSDLGEFGLIHRIRSRLAPDPHDPYIIQGIGDDCAVLAPPSGQRLLITTDTMVENIDFLVSQADPRRLGRKAMAISLSDLAAMGAKPRWALLTLMLPPSLPWDWLDRALMGIEDRARSFEVTVVGGDISQGPLISLETTLLGTAPPQQILLRQGARPGDDVFVTGPLGASAAGLALLQKLGPQALSRFPSLEEAHFDPLPHVAAGMALAASGKCTAMIDISDGLAADLAHLAKASAVDIHLDPSALPLSAETQDAASQLEHDPLDWALAGGEDFCLALTAPPRSHEALAQALKPAHPGELVRIGMVVPGEGKVLVQGLCPKGGYEHFSQKP